MNAAIRPNAAEACNAVDDDCDGQTDEATPLSMCGPMANGTPVCTAGTCMASCDAGYYDVNRVASDGCECVEDGFGGTNTSCAAAADVGTLTDSGTSRSIAGRLLPGVNSDWYKVSVTDGADAGDFAAPGADKYHFRVALTGNQMVRAQVYRGSCAAGSSPMCPTNSLVDGADWFTDFTDVDNRIGASPCVSQPVAGSPLWSCCRPGECQMESPPEMDTCCGGLANDNSVQCSDSLRNVRYCLDDTTTFYVRVFRTGGVAATCGEASYTLTISNGPVP
jgi:hypothetical protein